MDLFFFFCFFFPGEINKESKILEYRKKSLFGWKSVLVVKFLLMAEKSQWNNSDYKRGEKN